MRLSHPIFNTPLKPKIELTKVDTPKNYLNYPSGKELGKTIEVWKVHEHTYPEIDVGLVSDPNGFEDSPDAEIISSGINSKGPHSVALGRQGNFFLWGFFGDASMLTPSARAVFINTIHYMKQFDGQTPLVHKESISREYLKTVFAFMKAYDSYSRYVKSLLSDGIQEKTGMDPDKLKDFVAANLESLYCADGKFQVDRDVRKLAVSNRKLALLDAVAARLRENPKDAVSLRLIDRYVRRGGFGSAEAFDAWLKKNRDALFFSDVGGYRWFVDPYAKKQAGKAPAMKEL